MNEPALSRDKDQSVLLDMVQRGEVAIIPAGVRCATKPALLEKLGISQAGLPFDNGVFVPHAVASVLRDPVIRMTYPDRGATHAPCVKDEKYTDPVLGFGAKFLTTTYKKINEAAISKDHPDVNHYLDGTFGYYTADLHHKFVLTHCNWHKFADESISKGVCDPKINVPAITDMMNRRIKRMFGLCKKAKCILFVFAEVNGFKYFLFDQEVFRWDDMSIVDDALRENFSAPARIVRFEEVDTPKKMLAVIKKMGA